MDKRYNLLYESWIKVIDDRLNIMKVSLIEVLENAHKYKSLAGETPLQNFAVERLLLAIAITIFYKYDAEGKEALLNEDEECDFEESEEVEELVFERWKSYYDLGKFPIAVVADYLKKFEERFWLFHPETPFYQVPDTVLKENKYGTVYTTKCMLGNIKESKNKYTKHHFSMSDGENLENVSDDELTRWIIHLMAYSINIKIPTGIGTGRLGALGSIKIEGNNLFYELLYNLVPIKINGSSSSLWGIPKPIWEKEVKVEKGVQISPPDNLPELYTIQSRRIALYQENAVFEGKYVLAGGEYYPLEEDPVEQMTLWEKSNDKKNPKIRPKKHKNSVQIWREFDSLVGAKNSAKTPGLMSWIEKLNEKDSKYLPKILTIVFNGAEYDSQGSSFISYTNDKISLVTDILRDIEIDWISIISEEIEKCEHVSDEIYDTMTSNIGKIYGLDKKIISGIHTKLSQKFFYSIDHDFRHWLSTIDPQKDNKLQKQVQWENIVRSKADQIVLEYINGLSDMYKIKEQLSIPGVYNSFKKELLKNYPVNR